MGVYSTLHWECAEVEQERGKYTCTRVLYCTESHALGKYPGNVEFRTAREHKLDTVA